MNNYDVLVLKQKPKFINTERMIFMNEKLKQIDGMNEEINEVKKHLLGRYTVALAKQCTQEYIVYYFYLDYNKNVINKYEKAHYQNSEGYRKKWKDKEIEVTIQKFLDNIVYDLLNRGYKLEPMGYEFD